MSRRNCQLQPVVTTPESTGSFHDKDGSTANVPTDGGDDRLVRLIAVGEVPFPSDADPEAALLLAGQVRSLRRQQLVEYVARQIAWSIHSDRARHDDRGDYHVTESI